MEKKRFLLLLLLIAVMMQLRAQQVPDLTYNPVIGSPAYAKGNGPVVLVDEGHNNFHTTEDRYKPFALLLVKDGYNVRPYTWKFTPEGLREAKILVIANALNDYNTERWYRPVLPAFTPEEVKTVKQWVENGGSLFLIADHMPFGGAARDLALAFGFSFTDGIAIDTTHPGPTYFYRSDRTLSGNIITNGRNARERVDSIASFTGQAFQLPEGASSIIKMPAGYKLVVSDTVWVFDSKTRYTNITGWSQAAFRTFGKGRVVVSGEAAMFTSQYAGPLMIPAGMNSPLAKHNFQLLLNIMHWLDRLTN